MGTLGSPPRAWGQLSPSTSNIPPSRFTPTRVGTTPLLVALMGRNAVHPHARGDNWRWRVWRNCAGGSPPRAWGQFTILCEMSPSKRFTPTRVGTTVSLSSHAPPPPVHPHARGDNNVRRDFLPSLGGSPPRAWGQLASPATTRDAPRFTPTRVGTTDSLSALSSALTVHFYARGDNSAGRGLGVPSRGSPPRAWGQLVSCQPNTDCCRFTPTRVGTTGWRTL